MSALPDDNRLPSQAAAYPKLTGTEKYRFVPALREMMSLDTVELVRNAKEPFRLNACQGDKVLIVSDTKTDSAVWEALFAAANSEDLDPTLAIMTPRSAHGNDPTDAIAEAMLSVDLCILATSTALTHSRAGAAAQEAGVKCILMDEITSDILRSGAANADYDAMQSIATALGEIYEAGSEMRITSNNGTDVVGDIEDQTYWPIAGRIVDNETQTVCAFPDGEVGVAPAEGSTQGTVTWDTTVHGIGLLNEPIELTVKDGWVVDIGGGREAKIYEQMLNAHDENARYCAAEFSVGINPGAEITGSLRTDKKAEGTVHIATGSNVDLGGTIESKIHIDGVIRYPSVWIDGEQIVKDGEITIVE